MYYQKFIENIQLRRLVVLIGLIVSLFVIRGFLSDILFTFIFTYLFLNMTRFITRHIAIPTKLVVIILYGLIVVLFFILITKYVPIIIDQSFYLFKKLNQFYTEVLTFNDNDINTYLLNYLKDHSIFDQLQKSTVIIFDYLTNIGHVTFKFIMSFTLSFFYCIEEPRIKTFSKKFLGSDLGWLFSDILFFSKTFTSTFGIIIETQILIAMCNTILMIIPMIILNYSQLLSLSLMIFFLSLIPVAGTILSTIPLSFIAYYQGGLDYVIYMLLMIIFIHLFESYFLHPKFLSNKTQLPIFYTFVILFISSQLFGTWGLIVGIPIFVFFLEIINVSRNKSLENSSTT